RIAAGLTSAASGTTKRWGQEAGWTRTFWTVCTRAVSGPKAKSPTKPERGRRNCVSVDQQRESPMYPERGGTPGLQTSCIGVLTFGYRQRAVQQGSPRLPGCHFQGVLISRFPTLSGVQKIFLCRADNGCQAILRVRLFIRLQTPV